MLLEKTAWFLGIVFGVIAATSVLLAFLEPGNTNAGELGHMVGRKIVLILIVSTVIYFGAKRMGWILKERIWILCRSSPRVNSRQSAGLPENSLKPNPLSGSV